MTAARVLAVSTGAVRALPWRGREVRTGIRKAQVSGPVAVTALGLAGDEQADLKHHGGPDKAVLLYPSEHYAAWASELGELVAPAFGENLTTAGLVESEVLLGAVYRVGTAVLQVTQPRRPCYKLAVHHGVTDLAARTQRTGRTGFYCRVLTPGHVEAGDALTPLDRPDHGVTAAEAHRVVNVDRHDRDGCLRLLAHPGVLPAQWVDLLRDRLSGRLDDQSRRLEGPASA